MISRLQAIKITPFYLISFLVIILSFSISMAQEKKEEETYSISLTKTAEADKDIVEVEDKKVLTETYTIQKGDHIWQLFRERGLLEKRNLTELLSTLKNLNKSLSDLDLIHPGEKLIIPLQIAPGKGITIASETDEATKASLAFLKKLDLQNYTVKSGDYLVKIVQDHYTVPEQHLYNEYLNLVKILNPSIANLNLIYPGQVVKLPIYSPQIVRLPIPRTSPPKHRYKIQKVERNILNDQLRQIFTQMGEEWVQTGEHFIPLKSSGQANLKAESYPIINLSNGNKVIVDLHNNLPQKMSKLIQSSWENYKVVHLGKDEDLRTALNKILPACDYNKIYNLGEPLELGGDIPLRITADWIIQSPAGLTGEKDKMIMITLVDEPAPKTPQPIKGFLGSLGIKAIDYPPGEEPIDQSTDTVEILKAGSDGSSLVEVLLDLTGQAFNKQVRISVYQSEKSDFDLVINADFLLNVEGKDAIIDLTGLEPGMVSLLREHQFLVLSLAGEEDPSSLVSKTLKFLDVQFDSKPCQFMATKRDESRNIMLTIPCIIFRDNNNQKILATHLVIPYEIVSFLSQRGYKVFDLTLS